MKKKILCCLGVIIGMMIILISCGVKRKGIDVSNIDHSKIVIGSTGISESIVSYGDISDLMRDSDLIVKGVIQDVTCFVPSISFVLSDITVEVETVYGGNVNVGDEIIVEKCGGIVPLKNAIRSFPGEDGNEFAKGLTEEEINTGYFSQMTQGDVYLPAGTEVILFLSIKENAYLENETVYEILGEIDGQYVKVDENSYFNTNVSISYDEVKDILLQDTELYSINSSSDNSDPTTELIANHILTEEEIVSEISKAQ